MLEIWGPAMVGSFVRDASSPRYHIIYQVVVFCIEGKIMLFSYLFLSVVEEKRALNYSTMAFKLHCKNQELFWIIRVLYL